MNEIEARKVLVEIRQVVPEEVANVVTNIYGDYMETWNNLCYYYTGYRDYEQLLAEER